MSEWDETDYNKWRDYPPKVYRGIDLFGRPHPWNTCSFESDGHSVLISLNYEVAPLKAVKEKDFNSKNRWFTLLGYCISVWSKRSALVSVNRTVESLDEVDSTIKELKELVNSACHHDRNNTRLPAPYMVHKFKCHTCGETWGYDSSG